MLAPSRLRSPFPFTLCHRVAPPGAGDRVGPLRAVLQVLPHCLAAGIPYCFAVQPGAGETLSPTLSSRVPASLHRQPLSLPEALVGQSHNRPGQGGALTDEERVTRIELVSPTWEAGVLPLNHTRVTDRTLPVTYSRRKGIRAGVRRVLPGVPAESAIGLLGNVQ